LRFDLGGSLPDAASAAAGRHVERCGRAPDIANRAGTGRLEAAGEKPENERGSEAEKSGRGLQESLAPIAASGRHREAGEREGGGEEEIGDRSRQRGERIFETGDSDGLKARDREERQGERHEDTGGCRGPPHGMEAATDLLPFGRAGWKADRMSGRACSNVRVRDEPAAAGTAHDGGSLPAVPVGGERPRRPDEEPGDGDDERRLR